MPPRRANRHQNIADLYEREDPEQMKQCSDERFNKDFEKVERMKFDMNRNQRRVSPRYDRERRESSLSINRDRGARDNRDYQKEERRAYRGYEHEPSYDYEKRSREDVH